MGTRLDALKAARSRLRELHHEARIRSTAAQEAREAADGRWETYIEKRRHAREALADAVGDFVYDVRGTVEDDPAEAAKTVAEGVLFPPPDAEAAQQEADDAGALALAAELTARGAEADNRVAQERVGRQEEIVGRANESLRQEGDEA